MPWQRRAYLLAAPILQHAPRFTLPVPPSSQSYDVAVARAVAETRVLAELCLPFVRVGGFWVAAKGPAPDTEVRVHVYVSGKYYTPSYPTPQNPSRCVCVLTLYGSY